ncbi:hypothetical protein ABFS82_07G003300 [Erythranthe guttata]|uniref:Uncharacterized protein n=2 Tax=Erythranthe guttata TaxID=4155 RepID=A0A022QYP2_ERYGU|nr:hypothetical protein MIMGU_mgv1a019181mg [Erythranthe guttata]
MCIGLWWNYWSAFRWPEFHLSTILRWPEFDFSYLFNGAWIFRWFDISVDDVLWNLTYVFESLALATMLCCFFLFCGCTL